MGNFSYSVARLMSMKRSAHTTVYERGLRLKVRVLFAKSKHGRKYPSTSNSKKGGQHDFRFGSRPFQHINLQELHVRIDLHMLHPIVESQGIHSFTRPSS